MKTYIATLKNGETRKITILDKVKYCCRLHSVGEDKYLDKDEILERGNDVISVDYTDEFKFYGECGIIRDHNHLFEIYRLLRNPIINLSLLEK